MQADPFHISIFRQGPIFWHLPIRDTESSTRMLSSGHGPQGLVTYHAKLQTVSVLVLHIWIFNCSLTISNDKLVFNITPLKEYHMWTVPWVMGSWQLSFLLKYNWPFMVQSKTGISSPAIFCPAQVSTQCLIRSSLSSSGSLLWY